MKWFKFYGQDWLTDLKIMSMSMEDRLCFITLLCLASSSDEKGLIRKCTEDAIIRLSNIPNVPSEEHNPYEKSIGCLKRYEALQIVTLNDNGDVTINAFDRRQGQNFSNAERQRNYRERLKTKNKSRNVSNVTQSNDSNARIDKNRIDKNIHTATTEIVAEGSKDIPEIIDAFKIVNPSYKKWFANKTQRCAVERLLKTHGKERLLSVINFLPRSNTIPFVTTITSPYLLEEKWADLQATLTKVKNKSITNKPNVII